MSSPGRRSPASARTASAPAVARRTRCCRRCQQRRLRGESPKRSNAISALSTFPGFRIAPASRRTGSPAGPSAGFCDGGPVGPKPDLRGSRWPGAPSLFRHGAQKAPHVIRILPPVDERGQCASAFDLYEDVPVHTVHVDPDSLAPGSPTDGKDRVEPARCLISPADAGADGHERILGAPKNARQRVVEMDLAFSFRTGDYRRLAAPSPAAARAFSISTAPITTRVFVAR